MWIFWCPNPFFPTFFFEWGPKNIFYLGRVNFFKNFFLQLKKIVRGQTFLLGVRPFFFEVKKIEGVYIFFKFFFYIIFIFFAIKKEKNLRGFKIFF